MVERDNTGLCGYYSIDLMEDSLAMYVQASISFFSVYHVEQVNEMTVIDYTSLKTLI